MMWEKITSPESVKYNKTKNGFNISGVFKFKKNIKHTRKYTYNTVKSTLTIDDNIYSFDESFYDIYFQINPNLTVKRLYKNYYTIHTNSSMPHDQLCEINIISDNINTNLLCGLDNPLGGWYSPSYDKINIGQTLNTNGNFKSYKNITTIIKIQR